MLGVVEVNSWMQLAVFDFDQMVDGNSLDDQSHNNPFIFLSVAVEVVENPIIPGSHTAVLHNSSRYMFVHSWSRFRQLVFGIQSPGIV